MNEAFKQQLAEATVLSLDVFDTVLGRRCAYPEDAFTLMEEALVQQYGPVMKGFAMQRANADSQARRRAWEERQAEEVGMEDIYRVILENNSQWPASVEECIGLELATERRLLYPLDRARQMISVARMMGKKVVFISDMYLPKAFCEDCLRMNGVTDYDAFYISSETGVLKHSGKLFQHALRELGIAPGQLLHVGDNPHSDVEQARKLGIRTHLVDKAIDQLGRFPDNPLGALATREGRTGRESLLLGMSARGCLAEIRRKDPMWFRVGYQVGGPLVYGYIRFLMDSLRGRDISKVYFLSRDGYILKKAYEILAGTVTGIPEADYLFASRRALNFAGIRELDQKTEDWLAEGIRLNVGQFLKRVHLDPGDHLEAIRNAGFADPDQPVVEGRDYAGLRELYRSIEPAILRAAEAERSLYLDYLREKGVLQSNPFVLVDVGWMTSIQHSFGKILHRENPELSIEGYYLGTYPEAVQRAGERSRHVHYLMEYGAPAEALRTIRHCVCLLEFFFAAPEHTFLRMQKSANGEFLPELAPFHENQSDLEKLQHMHDGILDYVTEMAAAGDGSPVEVRPDEILQLLHRYLARPTSEEARELGEIHYADGYGSYFHHTHMARPSGFRGLGLSKRKWKKEFKLCHWPMGYYMRLHPAERLLFKLFHPSAKFSKPYG